MNNKNKELLKSFIIGSSFVSFSTLFIVVVYLLNDTNKEY